MASAAPLKAIGSRPIETSTRSCRSNLLEDWLWGWNRRPCSFLALRSPISQHKSECVEVGHPEAVDNTVGILVFSSAARNDVGHWVGWTWDGMPLTIRDLSSTQIHRIDLDR